MMHSSPYTCCEVVISMFFKMYIFLIFPLFKMNNFFLFFQFKPFSLEFYHHCNLKQHITCQFVFLISFCSIIDLSLSFFILCGDPPHFPDNFPCLQITDLLVNITKHDCKPKHQVLTEQEKQSLLKKYSLNETQVSIQSHRMLARSIPQARIFIFMHMGNVYFRSILFCAWCLRGILVFVHRIVLLTFILDSQFYVGRVIEVESSQCYVEICKILCNFDAVK